MLLFCVRVSCEDQVIYGPKWIAVEEANTLSDLLRCATGDKYRNRKFRIVVSSEKSLKDFSFVKLGLPVKVLDKNDKKIVSFLLKPDESTFITVSNLCLLYSVAVDIMSSWVLFVFLFSHTLCYWNCIIDGSFWPLYILSFWT